MKYATSNSKSNSSRCWNCKSSVGINQVNWIILNVSVEVDPALKPNRIRGEVPADGGIVITVVVVVEAGLRIEVLARIYLDAFFLAPMSSSFTWLLFQSQLRRLTVISKNEGHENVSATIELGNWLILNENAHRFRFTSQKLQAPESSSSRWAARNSEYPFFERRGDSATTAK